MNRADVVLDTIKERRSIRKYQSKSIPEEVILKVLEAGIWAPSGLNNQPWRFVLVRNSQVKKRLAALTKYSHIIEAADVLIVVFLHKPNMYHKIKDHQSAGACIQNMLLAAHSLGLGSCWLGEILKNEEKVKEVLELPSEEYELCAVVSLGYPNDDSPRKGRHPLDHFVLKSL